MRDLADDPPTSCDLLITGGRVIDPESELDAVRNVGVSDGKITYVGRQRPCASYTADASGFVVVPGLIDLHSHAQTPVGHRLQALDGVTTSLELEAGAAPIRSYYESSTDQNLPTNYGFSASWALTRMHVLDGLPLLGPQNSDAPTALELFEHHQGGTGWLELADAHQISTMLDLIASEVCDEGALGIGVLLGYSTRSGRKELLELARLGAELNVPLFVHGRFSTVDEPMSSLEGALELISLTAATGVHLHFCHVNSTYSRSFDSVARALRQAQSSGLPITTEAYPYSSSSTGIGAASLHPDELRRKAMVPSDIRFLPTGERICDERRLMELRAQQPGGLCVIDYLKADDPQDQAFLQHAMTFPDGAIASDAMPLSNTGDADVDLTHAWPVPPSAFTHPRSAGCFSRVLGPLSRDLGLFSLADAVRRCTLIPARILEACSPAMRCKGRLQVGCDADILVFDPLTVTDRATFERVRPSEGVKYLVVNGKLVVADGEYRPDQHAGQAVYGRTPQVPPGTLPNTLHTNP